MSSMERTPCEERVARLAPGVGERLSGPTDPCPWCRWSERRHTEEQRARCAERVRAELARRIAGPVRLGDAAGGRA